MKVLRVEGMEKAMSKPCFLIIGIKLSEIVFSNGMVKNFLLKVRCDAGVAYGIAESRGSPLTIRNYTIDTIHGTLKSVMTRNEE